MKQERDAFKCKYTLLIYNELTGSRFYFFLLDDWFLFHFSFFLPLPEGTLTFPISAFSSSSRRHTNLLPFLFFTSSLEGTLIFFNLCFYFPFPEITLVFILFLFFLPLPEDIKSFCISDISSLSRRHNDIFQKSHQYSSISVFTSSSRNHTDFYSTILFFIFF